jgi:hypothetical protein
MMAFAQHDKCAPLPARAIARRRRPTSSYTAIQLTRRSFLFATAVVLSCARCRSRTPVAGIEHSRRAFGPAFSTAFS